MGRRPAHACAPPQVAGGTGDHLPATGPATVAGSPASAAPRPSPTSPDGRATRSPRAPLPAARSAPSGNGSTMADRATTGLSGDYRAGYGGAETSGGAPPAGDRAVAIQAVSGIR